jgi:prepilin-type N-terminal cleavage/methylation domain-containing protein
MKLKSAQVAARGRGASGLTLLEVMVSVALASVLLATASSMWLFGSRSFVAMSNYADLDHKSRNALDLMSRDIRQATRVTGFDNSGTTRWLQVTNEAQGTGITYTWNASPGTLVCRKTGQPDQVYLTECDRWDFNLYQRAPKKGGSYGFFPATNTAGAYDLSICKLINMTWRCSRTILGSKVNTESVQTAQVVLRNKQ